jgi:hypothetical protein
MKTEPKNQSKPDWKNFIEEQEKSGLSQSAYCRHHGLSIGKFGYYRGLLKSEKKHTSKQAKFEPVKISPNTTISEIKVSLPNGFHCIFSSQTNALQVKRLIEVLLTC